jgi:hypothetical protein
VRLISHSWVDTGSSFFAFLEVVAAFHRLRLKILGNSGKKEKIMEMLL